MRANACAFISPSVCGVSGQVSATKSASGSTSPSRPCENTSSALSKPLPGSRLVAITRMPKARASPARCEPMRPEPDDQQRLAAQLVLALRQVRDHAAPVVLDLVVAREMQLARHRQDQRHRMLGDRARIHALRAREADVGGLERLARILVRAGADRLDELELRGARDQVVAPHHRDADHVGVARSSRSALPASSPGNAGCRCCAPRSARPCGRPHGQSRWSGLPSSETFLAPVRIWQAASWVAC